MLVQQFLSSSFTTKIPNSSFSSSSPSLPLMKNKKTSIILSPFFNSESTGFQPTTDQNIYMGCREKIKTHLSTWPRKLTSVMEIHRQRFSQLNPRFKQQRTAAILLQPVQQSVICPVILPVASRPQPRQQARSKQHEQTHLPPTKPNRRSNTAHVKHEQPSTQPYPQYITLANLTKILHVLQTQNKITDNETSTDESTSTTNSAKQRVQQHLQETATRWWKPIRSSDSQPPLPVPSSTHTYATSATPTQLLPSDILQQQSDNLPLLTIISNSTQQWNIHPISANGTYKYDESDTSTEIQTTTTGTTTVLTSIVQPPKRANKIRTQQEPLIMQARGMRLRSYDHYHYNQNNMNFLQQQRLIRQI